MGSFFKKNRSSILFIAVLALLFIPQTGMPIRIFINKLIAWSPSELASEKQIQLETFNWPLETRTGEATNLNTSEGKVVLINFWATWCPPCVAEMPSLQSLYDAYGTQVDFYFVTTDEDERVEQFMNKKGYDFPVQYIKYREPSALSTSSLPTTYVISKEGKIVMEKTGAANWDSKSVHATLDRLLGTPFKP